MSEILTFEEFKNKVIDKDVFVILYDGTHLNISYIDAYENKLPCSFLYKIPFHKHYIRYVGIIKDNEYIFKRYIAINSLKVKIDISNFNFSDEMIEIIKYYKLMNTI